MTPKVAPNHLPLAADQTVPFLREWSLLRLAEAEFPDHQVIVHIGWPTSSGLDRLAKWMLFLNLERLPRLFPGCGVSRPYTTRVSIPPDNPETTKQRREKNLLCLNKFI